jgi:hypothetical protein
VSCTDRAKEVLERPEGEAAPTASGFAMSGTFYRMCK